MPFSGRAKIEHYDDELEIESSARFSVDSRDLRRMGVRLSMIAGLTGTGLDASGSVDNKGRFSLQKFRVVQVVEDPLDDMWIAMRTCDLRSKRGDTILEYRTSGLSVNLDADRDQQKLTVAKEIGPSIIAQSVTTQGDVSVQYTRKLPTGSVIATIQSKDSVHVKWSVGKWITNIYAPIGKDFAKNAKVTLRCSGIDM
ncbi:hypothetical protein FisN_10Hu157 [Fistulifera solaris]|jgi:hypothetical protein|uniref:Uncharacterized protein n=1 Tax=Fistulifera solaris TaxID=1519565 RepID=A0A1Z5JX62_FISSO|nr:hypothetical protein FisN_10Hu157 [Fistulifera solaris]|eukprot:GAX18633.1 hypothetical protein FisN_10Hu157 [Fistulifera solaris]